MVRKFKFFIDLEKEEKWLEEMARQGYLLEDKSFGYQFRSIEPEDATIKIDYRTFKKQEDFIDYCTLFEDSGWKHIYGKKGSGTQYFKKMDDESDDIFSDKVSKAGKYKRLSKRFMETAISFLPLLMIFYLTDVININALFYPKEWYLTPGLWNLEGMSFWRAFMFETPIALMRGLAWLFIPITIITSFYFSSKAERLFELNSK